jgi:hypothetical protein
VTHAELYDKAGNLFVRYVKGAGTFIAPPLFDPRGYDEEIRFGMLAFNNAFPVLGISPDKEQVGTLTMHLDLSSAYAHLGYQIAVLLLIALVCSAVVSVALSRLQDIITMPLKSLSETMSNVSKDSDFSARAIVSRLSPRCAMRF